MKCSLLRESRKLEVLVSIVEVSRATQMSRAEKLEVSALSDHVVRTRFCEVP